MAAPSVHTSAVMTAAKSAGRSALPTAVLWAVDWAGSTVGKWACLTVAPTERTMVDWMVEM